MSPWQSFSVKTEVVFGPGTLERLHAFRGERVAIVTDALMVRLGAVERVRAQLPQCAVRVFDQVVPDPPLQSVRDGAALLAGFRPGVVIGLGGGSAIDTAKAVIAILRRIERARPIVQVAIPTTSGTGSEVTAYSVVSDPERGAKFPLVYEEMIPDLALLEPEFVRSVPPAVTADTGMDVVTHALEAYVSTGANDFTDAFAEKALALAFEHLPQAFGNGDDMAARVAMHNASCMAGMAFNGAGLGVNHGLAHAIGARFHLAHGRANALLLPVVAAFNAGLHEASLQPAAARYARIARRIGCAPGNIRDEARALVDALRSLNARLAIPATLQAFGVTAQALADAENDIADAALADPCTATNPRAPSRAQTIAMIRSLGG